MLFIAIFVLSSICRFIEDETETSYSLYQNSHNRSEGWIVLSYYSYLLVVGYSTYNLKNVELYDRAVNWQIATLGLPNPEI